LQRNNKACLAQNSEVRVRSEGQKSGSEVRVRGHGQDAGIQGQGQGLGVDYWSGVMGGKNW